MPATETVSALLALPLAGGVTELGAKPQVTPAGWPEHERATALLKPRGVTHSIAREGRNPLFLMMVAMGTPCIDTTPLAR